MKIISIHDGHCSAAGYMEDGIVKFAIQEERLLKIKNAGGFPKHALQEILSRFNLSVEDIDHFVFCDTQSQPWVIDARSAVLAKYGNLFKNPKHKFYRKILSFLKKRLKKYLEHFISKRNINKNEAYRDFRIQELIDRGVPKEKISFLDHHLCHASAAGYGWGKGEKVTVITSDSAGDSLSGSVSTLENGTLNRHATISASDSIARLYSLVTYYMGMVPLEHEYKLMGLAAYVENSKTANEISDYLYNLFQFNDDGLTYKRKENVHSTNLLGNQLKEFLAFKRFDAVSAGLQIFIERFVSEWVRNVCRTLKVRKVALSGGLFMNVKLNKILSELKEVDEIFAFPSCGDESNIFGALYYRYHELTKQKPFPVAHYYTGGDFTNEQIINSVKNFRFKSSKVQIDKISDMPLEIARLLSENKIVARFGGNMEFGARALGNRSILANPANYDSVKIINKMIKCRDFWMPFAPSMIKCKNYLINPKNIKSPYMMFAFNAKKEKIPVMRSALHPYDDTCRPQEVVENWNPNYYRLISEFEKITGESVILNTSFNLHGYPIVYTPEDALYVFDNSGLNYLALGDYLIQKRMYN